MTQIALKGQARRVLRTRTTSQAISSQHAAGQQAAEHRARSQRGASMSFALFLFLICAILTSIVLAASTAAAGRSINLADRDKHYYSAISAAELLKGQIESKIVKLECTDESLKIVESNLKDNNIDSLGLNTVDPGKEIATNYQENGSPASIDYAKLTTLSFLYLIGQPNTNTLLEETSIYSVITPKNLSDAGDYGYASLWNGISKYYEDGFLGTTLTDPNNAYEHYVTSEYKLSSDTSTITNENVKQAVNDALDVKITQKTYADGSFDVTVKSGDADDDSNAVSYDVRLRCDADVDVKDVIDGESKKKEIKVQWKVTQLYDVIAE